MIVTRMGAFKREKLADDLIKMINTLSKETPPAPRQSKNLFQSHGIIKVVALDNLGAWQVLPNIQYLMMLFPIVVALAEDLVIAVAQSVFGLLCG